MTHYLVRVELVGVVVVRSEATYQALHLAMENAGFERWIELVQPPKYCHLPPGEYLASKFAPNQNSLVFRRATAAAASVHQNCRVTCVEIKNDDMWTYNLRPLTASEVLHLVWKFR